MQYTAHDDFVAPARIHAKIWQLVVGFLLILWIYAMGIGLVLLGVLVVSGAEGVQRWFAEMMEATGPTGTLLLLATFIGMAAGPMIVAKLLHSRPVGSLFGPIPRTMRHFLIAMLICALVFSLTFLIPTNIAPQPGLAPGLWLSFLPLALVGVFIQTGAEEILFRGYLQQQLAARFRSPIAWMIVPSVLFALAHYSPDMMGGNAWLIVLAVGVFALIAADLTALTGSIGAAWGFHFANNVVAILVVSLEGPLSGLALYTSPMSAADPTLRPLIFLDIGTTLVTWLVIRTVLRRV
ncbi:CPBP family intramembrane glutamic endopeptidase [Gymnodinialimonas sp. 2305UL16-5]|uniref:CPBP family intramembrane glutamic endopeptidase n=1 Tax=Gymnodinialimonas mytili TaxID=3126503 RepID=UPI0030989782